MRQGLGKVLVEALACGFGCYVKFGHDWDETGNPDE
jgi:hypothetical protein